MGRIAVFENTRYNEQHDLRSAHFYFLDFEEQSEVPGALLSAAMEWARKRDLDQLIGPLCFGGSTGGGILIKGFEHRAAMTMMAYNFRYYKKMLEASGLRKKLDLHSAYLEAERFELPERVRVVAERVLKRGRFKVLKFTGRRDLKKIAFRIGQIYNEALGDHVEAYPLSNSDIRKMARDLTLVADPSLIKVLAYKDDVAGFLFAFPDLSAAIQRARGRLTPGALIRLFREFKQTEWLIVNGAGILPRYQRLGGNAILYYELEKTVRSRDRQFRHVDLTQVAESTGLMLDDIKTLGGNIYKTHRIFQKTL